jgi:hypothetical protein
MIEKNLGKRWDHGILKDFLIANQPSHLTAKVWRLANLHIAVLNDL